MRERADGLLACKVDHACAAGTYRFDLGPMVLNVAIPGDDQPSLAGGFRNPDFIVGIDLRDRAWCPYPAAFDRATWVAWVGDVSSDLYEDLREAEYVSIDVVADNCRASPACSCRPR